MFKLFAFIKESMQEIPEEPMTDIDIREEMERRTRLREEINERLKQKKPGKRLF